MIKDRLENANVYYGISENLKNGLEWLKNIDFSEIELGKHFINGERLYANIQEYETKDDADFEAHKKYIDIQYMIYGKEFVEVCDRKGCNVSREYSCVNDIEFLKCVGEKSIQELNSGEFLILFPHDAHKPSINPNIKTTVKKVVVKVLID